MERYLFNRQKFHDSKSGPTNTVWPLYDERRTEKGSEKRDGSGDLLWDSESAAARRSAVAGGVIGQAGGGREGGGRKIEEIQSRY